MSHWCWYAPSTWASVLMLAPLLFLYVGVTPLIVKRYAMVMSLGKPDARAMSNTIEYMDNNDQALHQVAELIVANKDENETIDDIFQDWDANGDGELTAKELQDAMHDSNMHMQAERFKAMWRRIDIDSSGAISKDEFKRAISPYVDQVVKEEKEAKELQKKNVEEIEEFIRKSRTSVVAVEESELNGGGDDGDDGDDGNGGSTTSISEWASSTRPASSTSSKKMEGMSRTSSSGSLKSKLNNNNYNSNNNTSGNASSSSLKRNSSSRDRNRNNKVEVTNVSVILDAGSKV
jgi:Ca2+-binding EF-hand superfamily protein